MPQPNKKTPSTKLQDVTAVAFSLIGDKGKNPFDLYIHLKENKDKVFQTPLQLISEQGHNLLHEMVDKNRISMFIIIIIFGWWKTLISHNVPEESSSEHKGCTPKEIADNKRQRKPSLEIRNYTEWEENLTPLMKACRCNDLKKVEYLLKNDESEANSYIDPNGWNALYWTVVNGNPEMLSLLLNAGIDPLVKAKKNETLLHVAAMFGKYHLFKTLMQHEKSNLNPYTLDLNSKSAYDKIAENGDTESLRTLVSCGFPPKAEFLVLAAYNGRCECVEYCLKELKMDVNSVDVYNRTALHRACENKKLDMVRLLLKHSGNLYLETSSKRNVMHILAESGDENLAIEILDILKKEKKLSEMINQKDRYNGVELCFLIRGRDRGRDAWHYVEVKRQQVPLFLRKTKAGNVDVALFGEVIKSGWGVNPDQESITWMEDKFKQRKLNQNADLDMTPLHIAIFKDNKTIAELLLNNGAKVNEPDKFGLTPLMLAASNGDLQTFKLLEQAGASFEDVSKEAKTALEIAENNEQDEIIIYIRSMNYYQISENFVRSKLDSCRNELTHENLDEIRRNGGDVKQHIVRVLRDMRIDINVFLQKIGSGPVLEASKEE